MPDAKSVRMWQIMTTVCRNRLTMFKVTYYVIFVTDRHRSVANCRHKLTRKKFGRFDEENTRGAQADDQQKLFGIRYHKIPF